MAFGGLKGTLTGAGASVGATNALTGSVAVAVGDLVFVAFGQQTTLTASGASSSLVTSYSAQNAGTDAGAATGRCFYGVVTTAGTLAQVDVAATGSTNDWCGFAVVIEGPFIAAPIDGNPANITSDVSSPFTCPLSGTLAQANEVVIGWGAADGSTVWAASSPNLLGGNANNSTNIKVAIGYQAVNVTTSISPVFTAAANPSIAVLGTASFKGSLSATLAGTLGALSRTATATVDVGATLAKTLGTVAPSATATVDATATGARTLGTVTPSATASVGDGATLTKTLGTVTVSAAATVTDPELLATLAKTLAAVTVSASATVDTGVTLAKTLGAVASSASATVDIGATSAKTLGPVTPSATVSVDDTASASVTLGAVAASAAASVGDDASLAKTLGNVTGAGSANVDIAATLAKTLAAVTLAGSIAGDGAELSLSKTLDALTATGAATVDIQATLAKTLGSVTLAASGSVDVDASLARTLGALAVAASGTVGVVGEPGDCALNATLGLLTCSGAIEQVRRATGGRPGAASASAGRVNSQAAGASTTRRSTQGTVTRT